MKKWIIGTFALLAVLYVGMMSYKLINKPPHKVSEDIKFSANAITIMRQRIRDMDSKPDNVLCLSQCLPRRSGFFVWGKENKRTAPFSTFKIWGTLIGLECGIIHSPDEPFYKWDGSPQPIPDWERDLTVREAFQASCVPAFRSLARQIGIERMNEWLTKIGYGDGNTTAGVDVFWLEGESEKLGGKPLLISPNEQAQLMARLATGDLPCSPESLATLKKIMLVKETPTGKLYGKTGSSGEQADGSSLGWFVGYFESTNGGTWAFACRLHEKDIFGKDARTIIEKIFLVENENH